MASSTPVALQSQSLPRRLLRGLFSAREYAVGFLILCCILVELGVLWFTQQYEAATAPAGAALLFGVSAAGLVVLSIEALKLPIAWFAGTLTGWTRVWVNILALAICLLTAVTIKDIWTRDWDLQLAPSKQLEDQAKTFRAQAEEQLELAERLAQSNANEEKARAERILTLSSQIEQLQQRKAEEQRGHNDRVRLLLEQTWDPAVREQVKSIETLRDKEMQQANDDIAALNKRLSDLESAQVDAARTVAASYDAEVARVSAAQSEVRARNDAREKQAFDVFQRAQDQYTRELAAYEAAKEKFEANRKSVVADAAREIEELEAQDTAFFNLPARKAEVEKRRDEELSRLDADWQARPVPVKAVLKRPELEPLPPLPIKEAFVAAGGNQDSIDALRVQIDGRMKDRDLALSRRSEEVSRLQQSAQATSQATAARVSEQRRLLDDAHTAFTIQVDEQIRELLRQRMEDERARQELARSPVEIQQKLDEIPERVEALRNEAAQKEVEARKERDNTGASRFAAVLKYFMPNKSHEERMDAAYGILPPAIGLLAAFLPALVLELGVASLSTPPAERRRQRWRFWQIGAKNRRALAIERGKLAAERLRLEQQAREGVEERQKAKKELELRTDALAGREADLETLIAEKARAIQTRLARERDEALEARDRAKVDCDEQVALAKERASSALVVEQQFADLLLKYRSDLKRLSEVVLEYDANQAQ
jgi:hypothetical protein